VEISDSCVFYRHLVGVSEVRIYLIEVGPSRSLVVTRVYRCGECHEWRSAEVLNNSVGTSGLILDVEVEML